MKRPTLIAVLIAQTVLLFLVAWAGVYFARDEFLLATGRHGDDDDEALSKAAATTEENGVPTVRLSAAAQRNVGLEVAMPEPAQRGAEVSVPAVVLDASPLVELQGRVRAARHEADAARAMAIASAAERQRLQALFDDDRNASQRALDAAIAQAASDAARERGAQSALSALREGARAAWGAGVARELEADGGNGLVARLSSGFEVLLRASLRSDETAAAGARLLMNLPGRNQAVSAAPLGAAGPGAADGTGARSLLFRAAGSGLVAGQRITGQLSEARDAMQAGVLVPTTAVIWHAGQPWIYIRESNDPQDVSPAEPGAEPSEPAASAAPSKRAPAKAARDDDDDDDKPRGGAKPKAADPSAPASEPGSAASAPAAATPTTDRFQRRAVPHARRVGDHWFLPGYVEDDPVVVRGAQLLLSEELKFQIRNENDD